MTEYADVKVSPILREVMVTAAVDQYDGQDRAISRAGHEAIITWLVFRVDDDVRRQALDAHGFDGIDDLLDALTDADGADGRFEGDGLFDPLAAIRTKPKMADGPDDGWPRGLYLLADTPLTAHPLAVEDGSGDRNLLAEVLAEHGIDADVGGDDR